jgi:hypothetical protein
VDSSTTTGPTASNAVRLCPTAGSVQTEPNATFAFQATWAIPARGAKLASGWTNQGLSVLPATSSLSAAPSVPATPAAPPAGANTNSQDQFANTAILWQSASLAKVTSIGSLTTAPYAARSFPTAPDAVATARFATNAIPYTAYSTPVPAVLFAAQSSPTASNALTLLSAQPVSTGLTISLRIANRLKAV